MKAIKTGLSVFAILSSFLGSGCAPTSENSRSDAQLVLVGYLLGISSDSTSSGSSEYNGPLAIRLLGARYPHNSKFDFGSANVGTGIGYFATIENDEDSPQIIDSIEFSGIHSADFDWFPLFPGLPVTIGALSSEDMLLGFFPSAAGSREGKINIQGLQLNLTGTGTTAPAPQEIRLVGPSGEIASGGGYDFGNIAVSGSSGALTFTINNSGGTALSLTGTPKVALAGANAAEFSVNETSTTSPVAASAFTTFTVTFSPTSAGAKNASVSIANNDADENPFTINLSGTGVQQEIRIDGPFGEIASGGSHNFGNVTEGSSSDAVAFTVMNTGGVALSLTGTPKVVLAGANAAEFSVNETGTTSPVAASGSTTFTVSFSPASPGGKSASISIANNDSDENPYEIQLSGTGLASVPDLEVKLGGLTINNGGTVDFGFNPQCPVSDKTFTIKNNGTANLTLSATPRVQLSGVQDNVFIVNSQPTSPVVPGSSTAFIIQACLVPFPAGSFTRATDSATVSIDSDDPDFPNFSFTVTATFGC
ncbi:MAG: choice-of-anchor D domain-containing protein [Spirochaetales bacterium]|nr:choice-of-anchor D domain-containing protein [Spirochaetales bacterium]